MEKQQRRLEEIACVSYWHNCPRSNRLHGLGCSKWMSVTCISCFEEVDSRLWTWEREGTKEDGPYRSSISLFISLGAWIEGIDNLREEDAIAGSCLQR